MAQNEHPACKLHFDAVCCLPGHHFYERQPDALLPKWDEDDKDRQESERVYAARHAFLRDYGIDPVAHLAGAS